MNCCSDSGEPSSSGVFSSAIVTPRCFAKMTRCSSELNAASNLRWIGHLPSVAHVLDQILKRNALGDFQRALHFVHGIRAAGRARYPKSRLERRSRGRGPCRARWASARNAA